MTVFDDGKQKCLRRPELIDGLPVDEFTARKRIRAPGERPA
jgi:hypothetical protein